MLIRTCVQTAAFALILSGSAFAQTTQVSFGGIKSDTSLPVEMVSDSLTKPMPPHCFLAMPLSLRAR